MAWTYPIVLDWLTSKFRDSPVLTSPASGFQVHIRTELLTPVKKHFTNNLLGPYVVNNFLYFNCKLSLWNFPLEVPYHFSKS